MYMCLFNEKSVCNLISFTKGIEFLKDKKLPYSYYWLKQKSPKKKQFHYELESVSPN